MYEKGAKKLKTFFFYFHNFSIDIGSRSDVRIILNEIIISIIDELNLIAYFQFIHFKTGIIKFESIRI